MWQMVLAYAFVQGWIISSYIESLFDCSFYVLIFSPNYAEIVNCDSMTRDVSSGHRWGMEVLDVL